MIYKSTKFSSTMLIYTILAFFFSFIPCCQADYRYNLSICAIFQDEAPYLKEWIEFHRLMGVEHFYLYNHRSHDHYQEVLKPYILAGLVEMKNKAAPANNLKTFNALQCKCYTECLIQARGISQWVAFLDIDEYLFPLQDNNVQEVLKDYEEFGGVGVNWKLFGTSFVRKIPPHQLLIETLTRCIAKSFSANQYVKSIVRPECASHFTSPHYPIYLEGYFEVNTDKLPFKGAYSIYMQINKLRINHYWTRDEEFFYHKKILRQRKWRGKPDPKDILKRVNAEEDEAILRFVPALKKAMNSKN